MNFSNILAHRGLWRSQTDKNSIHALRDALIRGFGIETDIRDCNNTIVISHDMPNMNSQFLLSDFLDLLLETSTEARIALNIKSDGLQKKITKAFKEKSLKNKNIFVFDMSIPDTLSYMKSNFQFYSRVSEYEKDLSILEFASGAWVDNFCGEFEQIEYSEKILKMGKRVAFVSPELHGRDRMKIWKEIKRLDLHKNEYFEICTDFPEEAIKFFSEEK